MKRYFSIILLVISCFMGMKILADSMVDIPADLYDVKLYDGVSRALMLTRFTDKASAHRGIVHMVDEKTGQVLWTKGIDYNRQIVDIIGDKYVFMQTYGGGLSLYDLNSGEFIRKLEMMLAYFDPDRDIVIGYKDNGGKKVVCYRIDDGEKLWETKTLGNKCVGWHKIDNLGDSCVVVLAENMYSVNLVNGEIVSCKLNGSVSDKAANAAMITGSVLLELVSAAVVGVGVMVVPTRLSTIGALHSNVIVDSLHYFVADKNRLMRLDCNMNEEWFYDIPDKMGSRSRLYCSGDTLFMLNEGRGFIYGNVSKRVGKPFIAAFDKVSGRKLYLQRFPKKWNKDDYGKLLNFVWEPLYVLNPQGSCFTEINRNWMEFPLMTPTNGIHTVNGQLEIYNSYFTEDIYRQVMANDSLILVRQITDVPDYYLIKRNGEVLRHLPDSYSWIYANGDKLCINIKDDTLLFTDISAVIEETDN